MDVTDDRQMTDRLTGDDIANPNIRCISLSVCLSIVCLTVTFERPTQVIEIYRNVFTPSGTLAIH